MLWQALIHATNRPSRYYSGASDDYLRGNCSCSRPRDDEVATPATGWPDVADHALACTAWGCDETRYTKVCLAVCRLRSVSKMTQGCGLMELNNSYSIACQPSFGVFSVLPITAVVPLTEFPRSSPAKKSTKKNRF